MGLPRKVSRPVTTVPQGWPTDRRSTHGWGGRVVFVVLLDEVPGVVVVVPPVEVLAPDEVVDEGKVVFPATVVPGSSPAAVQHGEGEEAQAGPGLRRTRGPPGTTGGVG